MPTFTGKLYNLPIETVFFNVGESSAYELAEYSKEHRRIEERRYFIMIT